MIAFELVRVGNTRRHLSNFVVLAIEARWIRNLTKSREGELPK
jgi:hypothetical protein